MKYILKDKNGMLTESVDESSFCSAHEAMGTWELVSDEECEAACMKNAEILEAKRVAKAEAMALAAPARKAAKEAKALEDEAAKAEFEAFKAWKASQG